MQLHASRAAQRPRPGLGVWYVAQVAAAGRSQVEEAAGGPAAAALCQLPRQAAIGSARRHPGQLEPASAAAAAHPPFLVVQARFCAALALAHAVKLQPQALSGATPGIISPTLVSPAGTDEPGAEA